MKTNNDSEPQCGHIIDADKNPYTPSKYSIAFHHGSGIILFTADNFETYRSDMQKNYGRIEGIQLEKELRHKHAYNATVLDDLLQNPHLIPENCKGEVTFFWGTIYYDHTNDEYYVRGLYWDQSNNTWASRFHWLGHDFGYTYVAAIHKEAA